MAAPIVPSANSAPRTRLAHRVIGRSSREPGSVPRQPWFGARCTAGWHPASCGSPPARDIGVSYRRPVGSRGSVDFRLPPPVTEFRDQLRVWLAGHLTDEVRAASRRRGAGGEALAVLRAWDRTMAEAGWAAISW